MEPLLEAGMLLTHREGRPEFSRAERVEGRVTLIDIYGVEWPEISNDHTKGESRRDTKESVITSLFLV